MTNHQITYPTSRRSDHVDLLHGREIADPYRWLEDIDSPETKAWIAEQNKLTHAILDAIPLREHFRQRLVELWDYDKFGIPFKRGERYFFTRKTGLQNQAILYWTDDPDAEPSVLLDPNSLSDDGTIALSGFSVNNDGTHLAYGLSSGGSDWQEIRVREVASGDDLDDHIQWVKFSSPAWDHNGNGFYYSRYDEPEEGHELKGANYFHKVYYHQLQTLQSDDRLIYERPDHRDWNFNGYVTEDGRYLIIHTSQGTLRENAIIYRDLSDESGDFVELFNKFDAQYILIGNDGPIFYVQTDLDAPLSRIVAVDVRQPDLLHPLIPESSDALRSASFVNNQFLTTYLQDAHSVLKVYDVEGDHIRDIELPGLGSTIGFGGRRNDKEIFYSYSSFNTPGSIYRYDVKSGTSNLFRQPEVIFDPQKFTTEQIFYQSKDGTEVPMFISYQKGLELDGHNPTILYGYGGFNIPLTPSFAVGLLTWMEKGGVYVQANLRGGGEYGSAWHEAGTKRTKQNVFDDFIAAAEWLIEHGWTHSSKLAIMGGSNGGLLVAASMAQRPELFGATVCAVGVLDMLRFHKFTIGWAWTSDYGSPDEPEEFEALLAYSPYHNLAKGTSYPATLITTGDHDDRVYPAHSFKFAAALQYAQSASSDVIEQGAAPCLIRVETRAGHGAGKPTAKIIDETADRLAFLAEALNM